MQYVTATELSRLMDSNSLYAVFDIRERGEYHARQISFATSLPRSQIEFRIADLVPNPAIPLVVYDEGGGRAGLAAQTLMDLGYTAVSVLTGGLPGWQRQGLPVTTGVNVPSKAFGEKVQGREAIPDISSEELKQLIDTNSDIVIFDVRTPEEYARFCIPGGLNVRNSSSTAPGAPAVSSAPRRSNGWGSAMFLSCATAPWDGCWRVLTWKPILTGGRLLRLKRAAQRLTILLSRLRTRRKSRGFPARNSPSRGIRRPTR